MLEKNKPRILIITPFRNEDHAFNQYLESLLELDYPHDLIDIYWLENDSTDKTLDLLKVVEHTTDFKSLRLESIEILGPVNKRPPGEYVKDIPYGSGRVAPWLVIWNDYFLPEIRKSTADYVMPWYADGLAPSNVITEYLKVFEQHSDAGWVGGSIHRRHPQEDDLTCPRPRELAYSKTPVRASYVGHTWMMPRDALARCIFGFDSREMHFSLIDSLAAMGLYVYYQPSVFLKHISTDGKIYKHELDEPL